VSGGSIWGELGIASTATESELKRAYARKLRVTQPEDDPDGFVRLRHAYEAALAYIRSGAAAYEYDEDDDDVATDTDWQDVTYISPARADLVPSPPRPFEATPEAPELSADAHDMERANAIFSQASQDFIAGLKHGESDAQLVLLFRTVMQASRQVDLETASAMPRWTAQCLLHFIPASDGILPFVITYFGWDEEIDHGDDANVVYAVLARQRVTGERQDLQSGSHFLTAAWNDLTTEKPNIARRIAVFFRPDLAIKVPTLLERLEYDLYDLASEVRDDATIWWRAFLEKPRLFWTHIILYYAISSLLWVSLLMINRDTPEVLGGVTFLIILPLCLIFTPIAVLWLQSKNPVWQQDGAKPWHRWLSYYWIAVLLVMPPIAWFTSSSGVAQTLLVLPVLCALAAIIITGDYQRPQSIGQWLTTNAVGLIWPLWVFTVINAGPQKLQAGHYNLAIASAFLCIMAKNTGWRCLCNFWNQQVPEYAASSFLLLAAAYVVAAIALAINTPAYAGYRLVLAAHVAIVVINIVPQLSDAGWTKVVLGWGWIALVAIMLFAAPMLKSSNPARAPIEPAMLSDIRAPTVPVFTNANADLDLILANFKQSGLDLTSIKERNPAVWQSMLRAWETAKNKGAAGFTGLGTAIGALIDREAQAASKKMSYKQQRQWIENDIATMKVARAYGEQDCLGYFNGKPPKFSSVEQAQVVKRQQSLIQEFLLNPTTEKTRNRAKPSRQFTPALFAGIVKRTGFSQEKSYQLLNKAATNKDGCDARIALFETLLTLPEAEAKPLFQGLIIK
jgi:hypothetical protein